MHYINKTRFFALILTFTLLFILVLSYAKSIGSDISDSVVRLHIIANSNSQRDQTIKLKVRDKIISQSDTLFGETHNVEEALTIARNNTQLIRQIAEEEIRNMGFDYPVAVTVGKYPFPTRSYRDINLPAGKYNAVRIEIGKAAGENWWCVMYPPLCFTDGILVTSPETRSALKSSLSESEYQLITRDTVPVKVKFKIVELFQQHF